LYRVNGALVVSSLLVKRFDFKLAKKQGEDKDFDADVTHRAVSIMNGT